ncbi:MAG TPA: NAD(P)-dependent oxidoreductase [Nitrospiria bacterium]|nr:NAD(P)-dependent oxidoreductase [Nitrospiria bacterium]
MHTVAFLGLGIMGSRMATRLAGAGFVVRAWNRRRSVAEALRVGGVTVVDSPAEAALGCDVAITMLGDPASVRDVALGPGGLIDALAPGAVYVDMTTVDPDTSRGLSCACAARGVAFVDAPVTGSKLAAAKGELVLMVGGAADVIARLAPVFAPLARHVVRMGPVGSGSMMKLANNLAIAGSILAVCEAMTLGRQAGLDDAAMLDVLTHSALASPLLALKGDALRRRDFEPHFAFKHMAKDIRLACAEAQALGAPHPLGDLLDALFAAGLDQELGEEDFAALVKVVETLGDEPGRRRG